MSELCTTVQMPSSGGSGGGSGDSTTDDTQQKVEKFLATIEENALPIGVGLTSVYIATRRL